MAQAKPEFDIEELQDEISEKEMELGARLLAKSGKFHVSRIGDGSHDYPLEPEVVVKPEIPHGTHTSTPAAMSTSAFHYPLSTMPQIPRISFFSGEDPAPKGEVCFDVWSHEIKCLQRANLYTEPVIAQALRRSLKGIASRILLSIEENATVEQILAKLENIFGNVYTGESIMQQFYSEQQKDNESVALWACRIEDLLQRAVEKGHVSKAAKNDMLRNKFWTGIASTELKNASRHKYDTIKDYGQLLREVRKIDQETSDSEKVKRRKAQQHSVTESSTSKENSKVMEQLQALMKRMETLEKKLEDQQKQQQQQHQQQHGQQQQQHGGEAPQGQYYPQHRPWQGYRGNRGRGYSQRRPPQQNQQQDLN